MNVGFGKHAALDVRRLVVQHPDYVKWVLEQAQPSGQLAALAANVHRYIQIFDAKPFVKECTGKKAGARCARPVTRGTAYHSHGLNVDLYWWCDTCDPYQMGAAATLIDVSTYSDALSVVERYGGRKSDYGAIIKYLSRAKGMSARVTDAALETFFGP
jgi:hypothetical protein